MLGGLGWPAAALYVTSQVRSESMTVAGLSWSNFDTETPWSSDLLAIEGRLIKRQDLVQVGHQPAGRRP